MTKQSEIISDRASLERFQHQEEPQLISLDGNERNQGTGTYAATNPVNFLRLALRLPPVETDLLISECLVGAAWKHLAQLLGMWSTAGPYLTTRMTTAKQAFAGQVAGHNDVRPSSVRFTKANFKLVIRDAFGLGSPYIKSISQAQAMLAIKGRHTK